MQHAHHWIIERADGVTSLGKCYCGTERPFKNHIETEDWKGRSTKGRAAKKAQADMAHARKEYETENIGLRFIQES